MNTLNLQSMSSCQLGKAQEVQLIIRQKELEIKLAEIQTGYGNSMYGNSSNTYPQQLKLSTIRMEIARLENERNGYLIQAISYAMDVVEAEMAHNTNNGIRSFSIQFLLSSINSFIEYQTINITVPLLLTSRISRCSAQLLFSGLTFMNVRSEVDKLNRLLRTY